VATYYTKIKASMLASEQIDYSSPKLQTRLDDYALSTPSEIETHYLSVDAYANYDAVTGLMAGTKIPLDNFTTVKAALISNKSASVSVVCKWLSLKATKTSVGGDLTYTNTVCASAAGLFDTFGIEEGDVVVLTGSADAANNYPTYNYVGIMDRTGGMSYTNNTANFAVNHAEVNAVTFKVYGSNSITIPAGGLVVLPDILPFDPLYTYTGILGLGGINLYTASGSADVEVYVVGT
jgi:hypothetical protein